MNVGGGEAADQMVRMMLSGGEVAVRLSGSALKNVLALSLALARDHKRISGKVNLGRMLRETRDIRLFPMSQEQYRQFRKLAGKQKLLYSAIQDMGGKGDLIDVVLPVTELERANMIFERMLYQGPERQSPQQGQPPVQEGRVDELEGQRQRDVPKKDSRSERGSNDTKTSSSTPSRDGTTTRTSKRPSVEQRLRGFREQLDRRKQSAPTKEKAKTRPKQR